MPPRGRHLPKSRKHLNTAPPAPIKKPVIPLSRIVSRRDCSARLHIKPTGSNCDEDDYLAVSWHPCCLARSRRTGSAGGRLCRSPSQGRKNKRPPGAGGDQVRDRE